MPGLARRLARLECAASARCVFVWDDGCGEASERTAALRRRGIEPVVLCWEEARDLDGLPAHRHEDALAAHRHEDALAALQADVSV